MIASMRRPWRYKSRSKHDYLAQDFGDAGRELIYFGRFRLSAKRIYWVWSKAFLRSEEWIRLRYDAIRRSGGRCAACGHSGKESRLNVDHIRSRRRHPHLALQRENLQVLCAGCNRGKGGQDATDWRR